MPEIIIDPAALAVIGVLTGVLVQAIKRLNIVRKNADLIPLLSLLVGGVVGLGASFFYPVGIAQGIVAGILAVGGYETLHGTKNKIKGTGNGQ